MVKRFRFFLLLFFLFFGGGGFPANIGRFPVCFFDFCWSSWFPLNLRTIGHFSRGSESDGPVKEEQGRIELRSS